MKPLPHAPAGVAPVVAVPVVAVPVKDEDERIGACLRALCAQRDAPSHRVLLFVNDTTDGTPAVLRDLLPSLSMPVHVVEHRFAPGAGSAGMARRLAMRRAAALAGAHGVLLTTDADGRVAPDWVAANLHHLRHGADAVAGRAEIDPADAALIPPRLHEDDAREVAYATLLDEITHLLDPDPADPWPRHTEHNGASIAVTAAAYHGAGGIPAVPVGEDRAFFEALRRADARIRHAPEVRVTVSGRTVGRAAGGMADTIRRRLAAPDPFLDDRLERAAAFARRMGWRRRVRVAHAAGVSRASAGALARGLGMDPAELRRLCAASRFGAVWAEVEARSPMLARVPMPVAALADETASATRVRDALRAAARATERGRAAPAASGPVPAG